VIVSARIATANFEIPVWVQRSLTTVALLLAWEAASLAGLIPARILAAPSAVAGTAWDMLASGELESNFLVSLGRVLTGLSIAVFTGTTLALIAGLSRTGELAVDAPMQMLRTMPFLALVPLFILWFGIGETPKIALIALGGTFPIYLNLFSGIRSVDKKLVEAGNCFGLNQAALIRHVILPGALPSFLVGLRYSLGIAWLSLVVAEQVNATAGIGYLIDNARDYMRTDIIVVCLLVYSVLGLTTDFIVRTLERYALAWRPSFINVS
jgi:sulfonate transport system permease protein